VSYVRTNSRYIYKQREERLKEIKGVIWEYSYEGKHFEKR